ncbi:hypothetical protein G5714_011385 [Onychostoma macrolepis]|uniref:Uncharacterized protein n=1 Tax=Onychostoma macrolepis TaxID=369639 RepID=A0A7J6CN51_9TELE|nr:hypothetical protein G5714_011385 [Onychostoma macrolepis]
MLLTKTEAFLKSYRQTGFASAQATARDICEMNAEAVLKQKRPRKTKHHFSYESPDEPFNDAMKQMEEMRQPCATLSDAFTSSGQSDLNGKELALEHHDRTITFDLHRGEEIKGDFPQYVGGSPSCCNFSCKCG